jgi:hypothetical protein
MTKRKVALALATACAGVALSSAGLQAADAPRSYTWYAEVVAVDQPTKTLTVKAQSRGAVKSYASGYKPGDKLMIVWTPIQGESDTIIYAPKIELMKGIDEGYILPAEFVAADPAGTSLTFKAVVPDAVLQGAASVRPGQWIKVTTPMQQPKETAVLASIVASERPDLKPPPPPAPAAAAPPARARAQGAPTPGIVGTWTINTSLAGNAISSDCTFDIEGTKLSGSCGLMGQTSKLTGELNGNAIKFSYGVTFSGTDLDFAFTGTLDGNSMKGSITVFGMSSEFTGTKK